MLKLIIFITVISVPQLSCASNSRNTNSLKNNDIMRFAYANCLFQYFKSEGIDTTDIRHISGGIVEKSSIPINLFQDISMIISNFNPDVKTKKKISTKLNKCFYLDDSTELQNILN